MAVRKEIEFFAEMMEAKLQLREEKYKNRSYKNADVMDLYVHLVGEVGELGEEIAKYSVNNPMDKYNLSKEAADVANLAMMILDRVVDLESLAKHVDESIANEEKSD